MLKKLYKVPNIHDIVTQVTNMDISKRAYLNITDGNILSGDYKIIPELHNTPLGNFLQSLGDIGEARLLTLNSGESYTAHTDPDDRFQLAIITNPDCYMIDLDNLIMHHLPVDGQLYTIDTSVRHTATNFGARPRVHLNIRKKLPKFTLPGWNIKVSGGNYDWKQELYDGLMNKINLDIKHGKITGFDKIDERQVNVNCSVETLREITTLISNKGFIVTGNPLTQTDHLDCL